MNDEKSDPYVIIDDVRRHEERYSRVPDITLVGVVKRIGLWRIFLGALIGALVTGFSFSLWISTFAKKADVEQFIRDHTGGTHPGLQTGYYNHETRISKLETDVGQIKANTAWLTETVYQMALKHGTRPNPPPVQQP